MWIHPLFNTGELLAAECANRLTFQQEPLQSESLGDTIEAVLLKKSRPRGRKPLKPFLRLWPRAVFAELRRWSRSRDPARSRRAIILLELKKRSTYATAARAAGASVSTVRSWRVRFIQAVDLERGDVKRALGHLRPPDDRDHREKVARARALLRRLGWSTRDVAREVGLSQSTVTRLRR